MRLPRRQFLLLAAAVVVPCTVLIVLGLRVVDQERELASKREADARRAAAGSIATSILATLEKIRLDVTSGRDVRHRSAVALVAAVQGNRVVLPWDARRPSQRAAAAFDRLSRAGSLTAAGREREAEAAYLDVAAIPIAERDEHGVPLALYAIERLSARPASARAERVMRNAASGLAGSAWISPVACAFLTSIADSLRAHGGMTAFEHSARACAREVPQALSLARDFPRLALTPDSAARWLGYGDPLWLVSVGPSAEGVTLVVGSSRVDLQACKLEYSIVSPK